MTKISVARTQAREGPGHGASAMKGKTKTSAVNHTRSVAAPTAVVDWQRVTSADVLRAIKDYDRLGPESFFSEHRFAPTTTYELAWEKRRYPPKAILGTAYEFATGQRLGSADFEGGKSGRRKGASTTSVPTVQEKRRSAR